MVNFTEFENAQNTGRQGLVETGCSIVIGALEAILKIIRSAFELINRR